MSYKATKFKICESCGESFLPNTDDQKYCCDRCRWREAKRRKYSQLKDEGNCPQCGGEWDEPIETHRGKPEHCRNCQIYYANRYAKSKRTSV